MKDEGRTSAESVRLQLREYEAVHSVSIARRLGVTVYRLNTPTDLSGAVEVTGEGEARIWYHPDQSFGRQQFSTAHELGHLLLHPDGLRFRDGPRRNTSVIESQQEREADQFAVALLMPSGLIHEYARACDFHVPTMAKELGVSKEAVKYRLLSLGFPAKGMGNEHGAGRRKNGNGLGAALLTAAAIAGGVPAARAIFSGDGKEEDAAGY